jgi:hypothetical protein
MKKKVNNFNNNAFLDVGKEQLEAAKKKKEEKMTKLKGIWGNAQKEGADFANFMDKVQKGEEVSAEQIGGLNKLKQ